MKKHTVWLGTVALAAALHGLAEAPTNGVVMIATRAPQDTGFGTEYYSDEKGPGMATPGDVGMAAYLMDNGYTARLILDQLLGAKGEAAGYPAKETFLIPSNPEMFVRLIIMSGSGASADTPPPPEGIPLMMGEHVCLGSNAARPGSIYLYNGTDSSDPNNGSTPPASLYMKVIAPDHPILKGIPLDALGRVKIFRAAYPEENVYVPKGGKPNYEYRWCTQIAAAAAPGTTVLGLLDGIETRSCLAVCEKGGTLANGNPASARLVHMFLNENGSGGSRRVWQALTPWGRLLFLRAAKWAMGEDLAPYVPVNIKDVTVQASGKIAVSWSGSARSNYRLLASAQVDSRDWQTISDDIAGVDGLITRTLDISAGPNVVFLQLASLP
jgi:hypothetical protein